MFEFWERLTQPQASLISSILSSIVVPFAIYVWQSVKIRSLNKALAETQRESAEAKADIADREAADDDDEADYWHKLRDEWKKVRDKLLSVANDEDVDGRTRAKYARIDLRSGYGDLIDSLAADGLLGRTTADFRAASELWNRHRSRRVEVSADAVAQMAALAKKLA